MPFTCSICSLDITVGQAMLSDEKMNVAHESCVVRMLKDPSHPSINVPSVYLAPSPSPLPPAPPSPLTTGKVTFSPTRTLADMSEPCVLPSAPHLCDECQKPAIGMCPYCKKYVHQDYGYNGQNCSGRHEAKCLGAMQSRMPNPKPFVLKSSGPIYDTIDTPVRHRNGSARKVKPVNKKRGRR